MLDIDAKGDLYLYKTALLCKNEIIKRLINGTYHLAEESTSSVGNLAAILSFIARVIT